MTITKGVIAAAGRGTRFLPAAKAVPKELIPVIDKPVIQYLVEEFASAGIQDIIIVTSPEHQAIEDYFSHNLQLEEYLKKTGKEEELQLVEKIPEMANFTFLKQSGPYGNGTPCLAAKHFLGDETFVYAFGDDLVLSQQSFTKTLLEAYQHQPGIYAGVQEISLREVSKYGIVEPAEGNQIRSLVEKPLPDSTPSRLAVFGRYVLTPEIFGALESVSLGKGQELWMADGVQHLIKSGVKVYYQKIADGKWFTTGDPISYLKAVRAVALARAEWKDKLKDIFVP